jgi:hypothetical protein
MFYAYPVEKRSTTIVTTPSTVIETRQFRNVREFGSFLEYWRKLKHRVGWTKASSVENI